jgi:hypothetical protein
LKIEAITIACNGVAARVATSVAIAFDALCSPFVVAKANANTIAIASPGSIDRLYARSAGVHAPALARDDLANPQGAAAAAILAGRPRPADHIRSRR